MAFINKNDLYNLICDYYDSDEHSLDYDIWHGGKTMTEWCDALGVSIASPTMTALVREGLLVAEEKRVYNSGSRTVRYYHKPYSVEEQEKNDIARKEWKRITDAENMIKGYEDRKRRAYEIYEKCVADAKKCLDETLADYEQWYNEAVIVLEGARNDNQ